MNRRTAAFVGVLLVALMVRAAWAHEGHTHTIMGTVVISMPEATTLKKSADALNEAKVA